jgi:hypothetical protein
MTYARKSLVSLDDAVTIMSLLGVSGVPGYGDTINALAAISRIVSSGCWSGCSCSQPCSRLTYARTRY